MKCIRINKNLITKCTDIVLIPVWKFLKIFTMQLHDLNFQNIMTIYIYCLRKE